MKQINTNYNTNTNINRSFENKKIYIGDGDFIIATNKNDLFTNANEIKIPSKKGHRGTAISQITGRLEYNINPVVSTINVKEIEADEILINQKVYKKIIWDHIELENLFSPSQLKTDKDDLQSQLKTFCVIYKQNFILSVNIRDNNKILYFTYDNINNQTKNSNIGGVFDSMQNLPKNVIPQQLIWSELKIEVKISAPMLTMSSTIIENTIDEQFGQIDGVFKLSTIKKNQDIILKLELLGSFYDNAGNIIGRYIKK